MFGFGCKHEWEKETAILLSPYEQLKMTKIEMKGSPREFFQKKAIIVLTCKKCGKVKVITRTLFS